ncbi:hypothetical protein HDU86_002158 [Geranomyces michiganensis]|nr:hypothetical protein HDU86_002158 [Geranomyces michiganensis]
MTRTIAVQTCDELLNDLIEVRARQLERLPPQPVFEPSAESYRSITTEPTEDNIMATSPISFDPDATPKAKNTRHDPHATVYFNKSAENVQDEDPLMSAAQETHPDGSTRSPSPPRFSIRGQVSSPNSPPLPTSSGIVTSPMRDSRSPSPPRATPRSTPRTAFVTAGSIPRFRPFSRPGTPAPKRNLTSPPVVHGLKNAIADNADIVADFLADMHLAKGPKRVAWHIEETASPKGSTQILTPIRASRRDREDLGAMTPSRSGDLGFKFGGSLMSPLPGYEEDDGCY